MEEYYLKNKDDYDELLILWRNQNSIIIGRNQNTVAEINSEYVKANNISISRRISGGGAVFQDLGNVCFTIIKRKESSDSFPYFVEPIISYLKKLNIKAWVHGKNDIYIQGNKKVSGNAQYSYKDKIMHHGTVLYNVDFNKIKLSLKPNLIKLETKSIKSNIASVDNIINHLDNKISNEDFFNSLSSYFLSSNNYEEDKISEEDKNKIWDIANTKYKDQSWIFNNIQEFSVTKEKRYNWGTIKVSYEAKDNIFQSIKFTGDFLSSSDNLEKLEENLKGSQINKNNIVNVTNSYNLKEIFGPAFEIVDFWNLLDL